MRTLYRMLKALSPRAFAARRREREQWMRLLALDDYLLKDMGLDRDRIRCRLPPRGLPPGNPPGGGHW